MAYQIFHCNTSESGLGAVLYQKQNNKMKVIKVWFPLCINMR